VREIVIGVAADDVKVPQGFKASATPEGTALFMQHCAQCHGAPGVAPEPFALGMLPLAPNLVGVAVERGPEQIYWFIRNGLKMSGMPAWHLRLSDAQMWRITATVEAMPDLSPREWQALARRASASATAMPAERHANAATPDAERGRLALQLYGCRSCHAAPGFLGGSGIPVGPSLAEAGSRRYVAGVLEHDPGALVKWIMDPQRIDPLSAMPDMGVPERLARDIAAYLYEIASEPRNACAEEPFDVQSDAPLDVPRCVINRFR